MPGAMWWVLVGIWAALACCLALTAFIVVYRGASRFLSSGFQRRRALYQEAVDRLLAGQDVAPDDIRLRRDSDAPVLEAMLLQLLVFLRGPLQESVTRAAENAGLVDLRLKNLSRSSRHARAEAMEKLGLLRSRRAVPALLERLAVEPPEIRHVAIRALGRIAAPEALEALLDEVEGADAAGLKVVNQAIVSYGGECVPAILRRLERPHKHAEREVSILGQLRALDAAPRLREILEGAGTPHMRAAAAGALGAIADPDAYPALAAALSDPMREVRVQAAWALGRIGDPKACEALDRLLDDHYGWVRIRAGEALARLGEPGRAVLRRRAGGPEGEARVIAREMLGLGEAP